MLVGKMPWFLAPQQLQCQHITFDDLLGFLTDSAKLANILGGMEDPLKNIIQKSATPRKTNMTMENQPFEDISPIKNDDFPLPC